MTKEGSLAHRAMSAFRRIEVVLSSLISLLSGIYELTYEPTHKLVKKVIESLEVRITSYKNYNDENIEETIENIIKYCEFMKYSVTDSSKRLRF